MNNRNDNLETRISRIISLMDENKITSYEVAGNTSLTIEGVQKIYDGRTKKPRSRTLEEIEKFLNAKLYNQYESNTDDGLNVLAMQCIENWNKLMELDLFKAHYMNKVTGTLNMSVEEIFKKALSK